MSRNYLYGLGKKVYRNLTHPALLGRRLLIFLYRCRLLSDKRFISLRFRLALGYAMDWEHPRTFQEKLQWLKLYDRRPEYTVMVDKVKAKEWVAERIGRKYIIPTLGVWERAEDMDFDALPDKFVIKCNHTSGLGNIICKDKSQLDVRRVRKELRKGLRDDYSRRSGEWPYRDIPRRIIAEEYMEDKEHSGDLIDYKFFCFSGEPYYCQVIRDRSSCETIDFYDMDWKHQEFIGLLPIARMSLQTIHNGETSVDKPVRLELMKELCRKLAQGLPFARVDFYIIADREYFGEITFFPAGGMGRFVPNEWDIKLGDLLKLPVNGSGHV